MKEIIKQLINKQSLDIQQASVVMEQIMSGSINDTQLSALLTALTMKGETVEELAGFAKVMQKLATQVNLADIDNAVDIVGTGGDGLHTFNISTTAAFIAAGAGVTIAKHGNRSASGLYGSADLLEALGLNLSLSPHQVKQCVEDIGIGFMFAPNYHPAMQHVRSVRKELGFRTVFNLLGPLTNPSKTVRQLIGVYDKKWLIPLAQCFKVMGSKHSLLVNSNDGLDELSIFDSNTIVELKDKKINEFILDPRDYNLFSKDFVNIKVGSIDESKALFYSVLNGQPSSARNIVILNAGAAIYCSGIANSIENGIELATQSIDLGKALEKFEKLLTMSQKC